MSDLAYIDKTLEVKIAGQDATGLGVNFVTADVNGNMLVKDYSNGSVAPGTAASVSSLIGGQFNTALPTLTNTQQSAIQLDSSGRLIIRPLTSADVVSAVQSGTWTVQQGTPPWSVIGTLTNNNSSPLANNIGVLPAIAENAINPSRYTSNAQVLLVTDLAGNTNVDLQYYLGAAVSATNPIATTISDGLTVLNRAISAYGTAPVGTGVLGVNAYITNVPAVSQSGIWTVQPGNTQNTTPWLTQDSADGPVTPGTVAGKSILVGGQYNSVLPTLTNGQQSAIQLDSSGRLLVDIINSTLAVTQSGTWTVQQGTPPWVVTGNLTNNNSSPLANNIGALVATAQNTINPSRYTSNAQVLLVTDLAGNTNVDLQYYLGAAVSKTNPIATTISDGTNVITSAISAYGTPPTGTEVMGVNAYITNAPTVNQGTSNTLANAWAEKITDGTNGPVAVKPASTAPLATDPALVVSLSPNSSPQNYATGSGTVAALNGNVVGVAGGAVSWDITGTWVGTLTTQATNGDGSWINVASLSNQSGLITNSTSINGTLEMNASGWTQVRLIATAWTSGTATITWASTSGNHVIIPYSANGVNFNTYTTLTDSSQNPLGITPASTAATAAQEALVVAVSPNSALPTSLDKTASGTIGALNATVVATTNGCSSVTFDVTGTWVATIVIEGTTGDGNWFGINGDVDVTDSIAGSFTSNTFVTVPCGSFLQVRLRASLYTSGTATVNWDSSAGVGIIEVFNTNAASLVVTARIQDSSGNTINSLSNGLNTNTKTVLTPSSPTAATVGVTSAQALASNANRKGLVLTNTSKNTISFGLGVAAVLNSGITLTPNGSWVMDEFNFTTAAINAIASAASSNLAIQEFTT